MIRTLAVAVLLAVPATAPAQARAPTEFQAQGYEAFRALFDRAKVAPMTERDMRDNRRFDDMIVVIIGSSENAFLGGFNPLGLAEVVLQSGGMVLIAHDSLQDIRVNRGTLTQISGTRVSVTDPRLGYQRNPLDPFLVPQDGEDLVFGLFRGLNRVATEHPSFLELPPSENERRVALARFPFTKTVFQNTLIPLATNRHPFAIADAPTARGWGIEHRLLVLADPAVFMNSLLVPRATDGKTDNIFLADRVVAYLHGPEKTRNRCAFFEHGQLVSNFDSVRNAIRSDAPEPGLPPLLPLLLANQAPLVDMANKLVDQVQTKDMMNTVALGPEDNPGRRAQRFAGFLTTFLVMGSVWAAWFLLRRVWRSRQPTENPPPPLSGGTVTAARSGGVFDRRQRELVRRNNLYEPLRDTLRDLFRTAGVDGEPGRKPPPVECAANVRKPAKLREAIADLWKLAYGKPVAVTVRRSQELVPVIERLHRELADGMWRFSDTRSEA